jgi:hypothetical protein
MARVVCPRDGTGASLRFAGHLRRVEARDTSDPDPAPETAPAGGDKGPTGDERPAAREALRRRSTMVHDPVLLLVLMPYVPDGRSGDLRCGPPATVRLAARRRYGPPVPDRQVLSAPRPRLSAARADRIILGPCASGRSSSA